MGNTISPTYKQRMVARILVENGGTSLSVSKAMRQAGYSPTTAKTPKKLTESKGFQLLLDSSAPTDYDLARVLAKGLDANRGDTGIPDHAVRLKYLETILKLKGYI